MKIHNLYHEHKEYVFLCSNIATYRKITQICFYYVQVVVDIAVFSVLYMFTDKLNMTLHDDKISSLVYIEE